MKANADHWRGDKERYDFWVRARRANEAANKLPNLPSTRTNPIWKRADALRKANADLSLSLTALRDELDTRARSSAGARMIKETFERALREGWDVEPALENPQGAPYPQEWKDYGLDRYWEDLGLVDFGSAAVKQRMTFDPVTRYWRLRGRDVDMVLVTPPRRAGKHTLDPFLIDAHEVTFGELQASELQQRPGVIKAWWNRMPYELKKQRQADPSRLLSGVSLGFANEFVKEAYATKARGALRLELPTEAQWRAAYPLDRSPRPTYYGVIRFPLTQEPRAPSVVLRSARPLGRGPLGNGGLLDSGLYGMRRGLAEWVRKGNEARIIGLSEYRPWTDEAGKTQQPFNEADAYFTNKGTPVAERRDLMRDADAYGFRCVFEIEKLSTKD